jgi:peptide methionine sulfoxide reductase MsrB
LSPEQFRILRKKGTEMAGTGEYDKKVKLASAAMRVRVSTDM